MVKVKEEKPDEEEGQTPGAPNRGGELVVGSKVLSECGFTLRRGRLAAPLLPAAGSSDIFVNPPSQGAPSDQTEEGTEMEGEPVPCSMMGCDGMTTRPHRFCGPHEEMMTQADGDVYLLDLFNGDWYAPEGFGPVLIPYLDYQLLIAVDVVDGEYTAQLAHTATEAETQDLRTLMARQFLISIRIRLL